MKAGVHVVGREGDELLGEAAGFLGPPQREQRLHFAEQGVGSGGVGGARLAELLEQDPYDLKALLLLGRALLEDKRFEAGVEAFRRVLKFDPEQVEALFQLGVAFAHLHRYVEAVEAWEKVTRFDPGSPFAQRARVHARTAMDLQHIFDSDAA